MYLGKFCKVVLLLSFLVLFLAGSCSDEPKNTSDGSAEHKILAEFKIAKTGDPILLPVTFKDRELLFVLDTGCTHTAFDNSLRNGLGEVKKIEKALTHGSPMTAELFDAPKAFLGPLNLQDSGQVSCFDLKMLSLIDGREISGIIGMNFLRRYVIQIDFDKGTLSFLHTAKVQHSNWGIELAIWYNSLGLPFIKSGILKNINVDFIIDTGANTTGGLESDIFKRIISEKELTTSEILTATASGVMQKREVRIDSLSVGSFEYEKLIFSEDNWSHLGLLFLSRHIVTLDFPNGRMYLRKGKEFKKGDKTDMSGLHLLRILNQTLVYSVDEDSPAQKAGITSKDIILKVDDKDANTYNIYDLRRLLMSEDKRNITMTIKRGDDVKDVSFLLKKKI